VKINSKLKSNTSIEINENQIEIRLPLIWKMQKNLLQAMHQAITNEMGKTRPVVRKNQDHPLLNYSLENTPSKLKNNFMLFAKKLEQEV
jgi:hypothetical protein